MEHADLIKKIDTLIMERIQEPDMRFIIDVKPGENILKTFKKQEPGLYKHLVDEFFDKLHPY